MKNFHRLKDMCRYQMSVFSNSDLQSLNNAVTRLGIPVDRAISAEQAGYCKSDSGAYNHRTKNLACRVREPPMWPTMRGIYAAPGPSVWQGLVFTRLPSPISTTLKLIWKFRGRRDWVIG